MTGKLYGVLGTADISGFEYNGMWHIGFKFDQATVARFAQLSLPLYFSSKLDMTKHGLTCLPFDWRNQYALAICDTARNYFNDSTLIEQWQHLNIHRLAARSVELSSVAQGSAAADSARPHASGTASPGAPADRAPSGAAGDDDDVDDDVDDDASVEVEVEAVLDSDYEIAMAMAVSELPMRRTRSVARLAAFRLSHSRSGRRYSPYE